MTVTASSPVRVRARHGGEPAVPASPVASGGTSAARNDAVDVLRAIAIGGVLIQHAADGKLLHRLFWEFHVRQAVPVFVVLMGVYAATSFRHAGSASYSRAYFRTRVRRLGGPYGWTWITALAVGVLLGRVYAGPLLAVGYFPLVGPGAYYVTFLAQAVVILPLLVRLVWRAPAVTAALSVVVAVAYNAGSRALEPLSGSATYLLKSGFPQYLPLLVLGIWLSGTDVRRAFRWLTWALPFGLVALYLVHDGTLRKLGLVPSGFRGSYSVYCSVVPAWAVAGVLSGALVPSRRLPTLTRPLALVGRASYHIFLAQIVALGAFGIGGWDALLAAALAVGVGVAVYLATPRSVGGARPPAPASRA